MPFLNKNYAVFDYLSPNYESGETEYGEGKVRCTCDSCDLRMNHGAPRLSEHFIPELRWNIRHSASFAPLSPLSAPSIKTISQTSSFLSPTTIIPQGPDVEVLSSGLPLVKSAIILVLKTPKYKQMTLQQLIYEA
ncbi:hypothetical protein RCL1_008042 [Eukaryota sp. TZLM3-RCL]